MIDDYATWSEKDGRPSSMDLSRMNHRQTLLPLQQFIAEALRASYEREERTKITFSEPHALIASENDRVRLPVCVDRKLEVFIRRWPQFSFPSESSLHAR